MVNDENNKPAAPHGLTSRVPVVPSGYTVAQTHVYLTENISRFDTIDYIYVTDEDDRLAGVVSIKDLYRSTPAASVGRIHKRTLVTATLATDPEEIAYQALKHGIKAVPLIDENRRLIGVIPHDGITRILHKELREDILRLAGVHHEHAAYDNVMEIPLLRALRHRLPWLLIGTLGGLAIAQIIGQFEQTLRDNIILAAFIPLVVYVAAAVGTQLEAFAIRDFALFRKLAFGSYFRRQFVVVLGLAFSLGSTVALLGWLFYRQGEIALVLGLAVGTATASAIVSGLLIPYAFRLIGVDPANASGPLGTIIQDTSSVLIYLLIASAVL